MIINQVKGIYACNHPHLKLYKTLVENLLEYFKVYDLEVTPRSSNHFVDMMASLGSLIPQHPFRQVTHMEVITMYKSSLDVQLFNKDCPMVLQVNEINFVSKDLWYQHIKEFLKWGILPATMSTIKK